VRLSVEERLSLEAMIRKGKCPAQRLLKARILLKADVSEGSKGWSDSLITETLETSASMVYRVRKKLNWVTQHSTESLQVVGDPKNSAPWLAPKLPRANPNEMF